MNIPSLAVLAVLAAAPCSAQLVDSWMESAVKSVGAASRLPTPAYDSSRLPGQVRILDRAALEASGAATLQELLSRQAGVILFDQVGGGRQQTLDMRGFNATPIPTTILLVDGAKVNEQDFGTINFQLIGLDAVERVEILPGPQTLFGKNALSGVVNVITRKGGPKTGAQAEAVLGSFGRRRLAAGVSGPAGALRYAASASRETEDGYRSNSASRLHHFDGRLDYDDGETSAAFSYRFADDDLKQAGSLTASEIGRDRRQNVSMVEMDSLSHLAAVNARRRLIDGLFLSANAFVRQRLENTPLNKGRTSISRSRSEMQARGLTAQLEHDAAIGDRRHILTAGFETLYGRTESDSSGAFGAFNFVSGAVSRDRQLGLFVQETFDLWPETVVLTAGLRWDRDTLENQDKTNAANDGRRVYHRASPRVGLNVNPLPWVQAYASLSDAFRAPTPNEITALGPFSASPFLKPVKARTAEAGVRIKRPWAEATAAVYRTVVKDEIYAVFDPVNGFGQNRNIDKTRRDGLELTFEPRWDKTAEGFIRYSYTEATFQTDFVLDKPPFGNTQRVLPGAFLPQVPRHRLAVGASLHPAPGWTLSADELCVGSQFVFGDESNTEPRLGGYCLAGAGASYDAGSWSLFVRADNLFDRAYESRGILATNPATFGLERFLVPAPGLTVSGGARWRFGPR